MKILYRLSLLLLTISFAIPAQAQLANCIYVSEFETGAAYGQQQGNEPGEIVYSNLGVSLQLEPYWNGQQEPVFGELSVESNLGYGSEAPYFQLDGISTSFSFDGAANTVCFTTSNNGTPINFGINGGLGLFFNIADPSIHDSFPDFDITISNFDDTPFDPVNVCISGNIEQFSIGGNGIFLDNICTDYFPNPNCGFFGPSIEPYCSSTGTTNLLVGFNEIVGANDFVDIYLDNEFYGFYPIESFPLNLEDIPLDENQGIVVLSVCINDNPDCCFTISLDLPNCMAERCVEFELFSEEMEIAFANDWPYDSVYHVENGVRFTQRQTYREGDILPPNGIMLRLAPNAIPEFTTGSFITMGHVSTNSEIDLSNYTQPVYHASFDFYRFDDESYMNIGVNGQEIVEPHGPFQAGIGVSTLPDGTVRRTSYSPLDPNMGTVEFFGTNITEIVFGGEGVAMDNLCFNQTECEITNLNAGQYSCDNTDPPFRFFLDFDHNYLAQDSFILQIGPAGPNSTFTYAYSDLPLTNIEITGTVGQAFDFTVTDQFFPDCSASFTTELRNCENACADFEATTVEVYCTDPFFYEAYIVLSTIAAGQQITLEGLTTNIFQSVIFDGGDGVTFGFFEEENDPEGYILTDQLSGCTTYIPPFDVSTSECMECEIYEASITPLPCNDEGFYSVVVDLEGFNFFQDYFISVNGSQVFGPFQDDDFPVTVGELPGGDDIVSFVEVYGIGGDCYYAEDVYQNCGIQHCNAFFPIVTSVECVDPDNLLIDVVIEGMTPDERLFIINSPDGNFYQEVYFTQNPISFIYPNSGLAIGTFIITDTSNDCQDILTFEIPEECLDDCLNTFDLVEVDCNANGETRVFFTAAGPIDDTFIVILDGTTYQFEFGQNLYVIELSATSGQLSYTLEFWYETQDCGTTLEFINPCPCNNFYPNIIGAECSSDTLELSILLDGEEPDFRELRFTDLNGNFIAEVLFSINPFPLSIPLSNINLGAIIIEDVSNGCEQILQYDVPANCFQNCDDIFSNIEVACSADGVPVLYFTAINPNGGIFSLTIDGVTIVREYGAINYEIALPTFPGQEVIDVIFEDSSLDCSITYSFDNPCNCNNFYPNIISVDCNANSLLLEILLDGEEPDGRELRFINGNFIAEVLFTENPFVLSLPFNNSSTTGAIIIEDQTNGCEQLLQYDIPPNCFLNCDEIFSNIEVDCSADGVPVLYFTAINPNGGIFTLNIDGVIITREYGAINYEIALPNSSGQELFVIVFEDPALGCGFAYTVENPCNCNGFYPVVVNVECEFPNTIFLDILLDGATPDGRELRIVDLNGNLIEEVLFTQNPFTVDFSFGNSLGGAIQVIDVTNGCQQIIQYSVPPDCLSNCEDFTADWVAFNCLETANIQLFFEIGGVEPGQVLQMEHINSGYTINVEYNGSLLEVEWPLLNQGGISFTDENGCTAIAEYNTPEQCINDCIDTFGLLGVTCNQSNEIRFNFTAQGPSGAGFTLTVNGQTFPGEYGAEQYVLELEPVAGQNIYELILQDGVSGCVTVFEVENPCFCVIEDIEYTIIECNDDGGWFLELSFVAGSTTGEDNFIVSAGGYTQSFPEGTVNTTIGPFTNSINESITVNIFAENDNCEESFTIDYGCQPPACEIFDFFVEGTPCDANGDYFLHVYFEAEGANLFEVSVLGTGISIITDNVGEVITLGPLNIGEIQTSLVLIESVNGNCAAEIIYVQDCQPIDECNFTNVFAEAHSCDGDFFLVDIEFDNGFGGPLGFYIFGDGMIFGPYQYGETFYTFGPLNGSEAEHDILILDIADPACFANYSLNYSCSDDCLIQEVALTPSECNEDGTFFVTVDVDGNNLGESFSVLGNGQNYGTFNYNDLPIEVGPFDGDNETTYELGIIDLDNPNCANWSAFGPVNCTPCDIRDLVYEVDCNNNAGYTLTIDFIYENPSSDLFALLIGGEVYEWFTYESLPLTLTNISYEFNGSTIRVEDTQDELCGQTIDFEIPCCSLGNVLNELEVEACLENGEYYLSVNEFNGQNLTDSLVIDYAPAGTSIIATVVVAYDDLPAQIGPLVGDGSTGYLIVLSDQENECSVTTNIEAVYCDDDDCVEFEGINGVFAPAFGHDSNTTIGDENDIKITYQRNPVSDCACNLFITNGIPGINFGSGQIVATQNSGFGLDFTGATSFNTVNIDYYYPGGGITIRVNGADPVTVQDINDFPSNIANGVELQVIADPNNPAIGILTFNGEIEFIQLFSNETAAFDNVCLSMDDNVWPGDTNTDNVASHFDLLNIGIAYGNTGPSRQEITDDWAGLISANWGDNFADGVNHKHADANGDGVINEEDRLVLVENYGLEHGPLSTFEPLPYTDLDPPIFVDVSDIDEANAGTTVQIPVIAGDVNQEIQNIYGMAFTIQLDPEVFDMSSIQVIYPTSWFGEPGVNTTSIERIYNDGRIEVGLSRIDHNNVSGFGEIMYIRVIIDDIAGINEVPTDIVLENVLALSYEEENLVLRPEMTQMIISGTTEQMDRDVLRSSFRIYPNPTQGQVYFRNQYGMAPDRITINDAAGRLVADVEDPGMELDFSKYPAGVYFLQVHLQGFIFTERLVKTE